MPDQRKNIEDIFVNNFIRSELRDRWKLFLSRRDKREKILNRLNHIDDFITGTRSAPLKSMLNHANNYYVISDNTNLDGTFMGGSAIEDIINSPKMDGSVIIIDELNILWKSEEQTTLITNIC